MTRYLVFSALVIATLATPDHSDSLTVDNYTTSAVLFVDIQGLWTKNSIAGDFPDLGTNLKKLVEFARSIDMLVVHIYADYTERDTKWFQSPRDLNVMYSNNLPDLEIMKPMDGEPIFNKSTFDGFYNTTLHEFLQSKSIDTIYAAGVATSVCVTNTVHGAFVRGYNTFYVKNCCGDDSIELHDLVIQRYFRTGVVNIADNDDGDGGYALVADDSNVRQADTLPPDTRVQSNDNSSNKGNNASPLVMIIVIVMVTVVIFIGVFAFARWYKASHSKKKFVQVAGDKENGECKAPDETLHAN